MNLQPGRWSAMSRSVRLLQERGLWNWHCEGCKRLLEWVDIMVGSVSLLV